MKKGELTQEEAISEIATLLVGPMGSGGTRDESKSLGKGKSGHINGINSEGTGVIQRRREGKNIEDLTDPKLKEVWEKTMKAVDRGWFEYEWRDSGEKDYYLKGKVVDYFERFDIHFSVTMKMDEFTAPTKVIRDTFLAATVTAGGVDVLISLLVARGVAKPFVSLSETSNKIIKGDLTARVDAVTPIKEFSVVSKDINLVVNSLQNKIEELEKREPEQANAIKSFSEILGKVMRGDMSARIDTTGWNEELAAIGVSINALIETLEFEKKEKS